MSKEWKKEEKDRSEKGRSGRRHLQNLRPGWGRLTDLADSDDCTEDGSHKDHWEAQPRPVQGQLGYQPSLLVSDRPGWGFLEDLRCPSPIAFSHSNTNSLVSEKSPFPVANISQLFDGGERKKTCGRRREVFRCSADPGQECRNPRCESEYLLSELNFSSSNSFIDWNIQGRRQGNGNRPAPRRECYGVDMPVSLELSDSSGDSTSHGNEDDVDQRSKASKRTPNNTVAFSASLPVGSIPTETSSIDDRARNQGIQLRLRFKIPPKDEPLRLHGSIILPYTNGLANNGLPQSIRLNNRIFDLPTQ